MFLRNGRVFREPRTKWLQLEPGDSALALTGQAGLKVDDHFFTVYDVPATRLAIIGWRAGTHGTHRTCVLVYNPRARSSWSFGTCRLSPVFFTKVCVPCVLCVLCVLTEKIRKRGVFRHVFQCVHRRNGWHHLVPLLRHLRLL